MQCPLCDFSLKPNHLSYCARWWVKFHRISKIKEKKRPFVCTARCPEFSEPAKRKATFALWQPNQKPAADELVQNGFFFTGEGDIVCCFWCKGRIGYWTAEDDPLERHIQDLPECSFAWFACEQFCTKEVPKAFHCPEKELPYHIKMIEETQRLESFKDWSLEPFVRKNRPSKDNLVKCGFFWTEEDLFLRCFWCNLEINYRWFKSENALCEHLQMKPDCLFAKNVSICAEVIEDRLLCKICFINEMEVVFLNCGHVASCNACSKKISNCPICRKYVVEKIKIYIT